MRFAKIYFAAGVGLLICPALSRGTIILSDDFARPNGQLDGTQTAGEMGGVLASNVSLFSVVQEQFISGGQLQLYNYENYGSGGAPAGVRFDNTAYGNGGSPPNLWNFASGAAGADITAAGGMVVSFTWTPPDKSASWISFSAGLNDFGGAPSVYSSGTDSGIILQDNGSVQEFANGSTAGTAYGFSDAIATHHVSLEYLFSSWADGTPVELIATVDGTVAGVENFAWNGTGGAQYLELDNNSAGQGPETIGNFSISTAAVPEPATMSVLALGAGCLLGRRIRKCRKPFIA